MNNPNPATPAPAATPGSQEPNVITTPSTPTTPPNGGQAPEDGKVTLTMKEFTALNRDAARFRSNVKRGEITARKNITVNNPSGDPEVDQVLNEANQRVERAEREALQIKVKSQVRDLLEKDEFKNLPKSTKELILKNPHLLSTADNLEEAMLDIEDSIREFSILETTSPVSTPTNNQPSGHETPPAINSGGPAPAGNPELEDITKLSGPAKSQAMIRNSLRMKGKKS